MPFFMSILAISQPSLANTHTYTYMGNSFTSVKITVRLDFSIYLVVWNCFQYIHIYAVSNSFEICSICIAVPTTTHKFSIGHILPHYVWSTHNKFANGIGFYAYNHTIGPKSNRIFHSCCSIWASFSFTLGYSSKLSCFRLRFWYLSSHIWRWMWLYQIETYGRTSGWN